MPVTHYGIFLGWQPGVELRGEGVGRYLAAFLKAGEADSDTRFVVVCPSWLRKTVLDLCKSEGLKEGSFELWSPSKEPAFLRVVNWLNGKRTVRRRRRRRYFGIYVGLKRLGSRLANATAAKVMGARSLAATMLILVGVVIIALALSPIVILGLVGLGIRKLLLWLGGKRLFDRLRFRQYSLRGTVQAGVNLLGERKRKIARDLYGLMLQQEHALLLEQIEQLDHVKAWYAPAAFWPSFNKIRKPRLMCVPDVVTTQFPVPFAALGNEGGVQDFKRLEKAILGAQNLVTYSETIKWTVLVDRYGIAPDQIHVIPHGANRLDGFITLTGFGNADETILAHCQSLVERVVHRHATNFVMQQFSMKNVRYLLFPSQFRPSKNVMSLLKAFEHVLRNEGLGLKLILTGDPGDIPAIGAFVKEKNLEMDVLFLKRVTTEELAALYRCAVLAVNPSLAEGGCPFTLTEALSVGTPVIMSRIAVTEEVIHSPEMRDLMLFDPYAWKDMASKIVWAVENRDELLKRQLAFYRDELATRTWTDVVGEYKVLLETLAAPASGSSGSAKV
jgi:glycosyltransferase involved in cell wall biosynthesis